MKGLWCEQNKGSPPLNFNEINSKNILLSWLQTTWMQWIASFSMRVCMDCLDTFSISRALLVIGQFYNVWNSNRKVGLANKMRGLPTFYENNFVKCRISLFLGILLALWSFFWLLGALPVTWEVWNVWKTNRKVGIANKMRGLTSP